METISKYQLVTLIILFEVGSSVLFQLGSEAKQDSWLAILTAMVVGLLILWLYTSIQRQEPAKNLIEMFISCFGTLFGAVISSVYILYFVNESVHNVRELGDHMIVASLSRTPISFIILIIMLLSGYAIFKGVEVFFRMAEFMFPFVLLSYFILILLFMSSDIIVPDRLLPVLENGIAPVLGAAFPKILMFPFGQMIVFLMFWKYLDDMRLLNKIAFASYLFTGMLLIVFNILNIMILGVTIAGNSTLPLLQSSQLIEIADFLERIDPIIMLLMFIGLFIKAALWYFGAVLVLAQLFKTNHRIMVLPVGVLIFFASFVYRSHIQRLYISFEFQYMTIYPLAQIVIPLLLLVMLKIKRVRKS